LDLMISTILFVNEKGETIISRFYRDNISHAAARAFRHTIIAAKKFTSPVVKIDKCSFMYIRVDKVFVTAVTKQNANPALVFQFLYSLIELFKAYFGGTFDEDTIRNNFVLIYELLDETMDHGYPQVTAVEILKSLIKTGTAKGGPIKSKEEAEGITSAITGAVDWRQPGKCKYRTNQVWIDVFEDVNLLMSTKGAVLKSDVAGRVMMNCHLTGMPECKFGMNDKLVMEKKDAKKTAKRRHGSGVVIDDVTFHRCVNLSSFDRERTINFVPPDGKFELMKYRITENILLPFRVIPVINEKGRTRVQYEIKIKGKFNSKLFATNVVIKIPVPKNCAKWDYIQCHSPKKPIYNPGKAMLIWKIKKFPGDASFLLKAECVLVASVSDKQWSRPPIEMEFQVPMFTSSGLHVRFMKVVEKNQYRTTKWVRYMTRAGSFQIRI